MLTIGAAARADVFDPYDTRPLQHTIDDPVSLAAYRATASNDAKFTRVVLEFFPVARIRAEWGIGLFAECVEKLAEFSSVSVTESAKCTGSARTESEPIHVLRRARARASTAPMEHLALARAQREECERDRVRLPVARASSWRASPRVEAWRRELRGGGLECVAPW